jgi:hypothetical protein
MKIKITRKSTNFNWWDSCLGNTFSVLEKEKMMDRFIYRIVTPSGYTNYVNSYFCEEIKDEETVVKSVQKQMLLTPNSDERKGIPITTGVLDYFPLAIAEVAKCSKVGNDQHNPGEPLHWDKTKSVDHPDCISRHLIDRGSFDTDGVRHSAKLVWRALALLQTELELEKEKK